MHVFLQISWQFCVWLVVLVSFWDAFHSFDDMIFYNKYYYCNETNLTHISTVARVWRILNPENSTKNRAKTFTHKMSNVHH